MPATALFQSKLPSTGGQKDWDCMTKMLEVKLMWYKMYFHVTNQTLMLPQATPLQTLGLGKIKTSLHPTQSNSEKDTVWSLPHNAHNGFSQEACVFRPHQLMTRWKSPHFDLIINCWLNHHPLLLMIMLITKCWLIIKHLAILLIIKMIVNCWLLIKHHTLVLMMMMMMMMIQKLAHDHRLLLVACWTKTEQNQPSYIMLWSKSQHLQMWPNNGLPMTHCWSFQNP